MVAAAAALPGVAQSAPPAEKGLLTVTASETAYTVINVTKLTFVDYHRASIVKLGKYGGLAVGNDGFAVAVDGDVQVVTLSNSRVVSGSTHPAGLSPGNYRLYVVSDGQPVTVTVPWSGPTTSVKATTPINVPFTYERRTTFDPSWEVLLPRVGGRDSYVYAHAQYASYDTKNTLTKVELCLTPRPACKGRSGWSMVAEGSGAAAAGFGAAVSLGTNDTHWYVRGNVRTTDSVLGSFLVAALRVPRTKYCGKSIISMHPCSVG